MSETNLTKHYKTMGHNLTQRLSIKLQMLISMDWKNIIKSTLVLIPRLMTSNHLYSCDSANLIKKYPWLPKYILTNLENV